MTAPTALRVLVLAAVLLATACRQPSPRDEGTAPADVPAGEGDRPYHVGAEKSRERVEALVGDLSTARGEEFLVLARRIVACGERAVPALLGALGSEDPVVRAHAAYLLGVLQDRRTIPDVARVAAEDPVPTVRYEAASALLELRDPRGFDVLVDGLGDPDARMRATCLAVLRERTGQTFGFEPDGPPEERSAAIRRWRTWLAQRREEFGAEEPAPPPPGPKAPAEGAGESSQAAR